MRVTGKDGLIFLSLAVTPLNVPQSPTQMGIKEKLSKENKSGVHSECKQC